MLNKIPTLVWLAGAAFTVGALAASPEQQAVPSAANTPPNPPATAPATPGGEQTQPPDGPEPGQAAVQKTVLRTRNTDIGTVLTDGEGRTLYFFTRDRTDPSTSVCYGACLKKWFPVTVEATGKVVADGLDPNLISVHKRRGNIRHVTYGKWPLYTFVEDERPGDTNGEGVQDVWKAMGPNGKAAAGRG